MTIYDNTSAFGLMSEEDRREMQDHHAAGAEIVYYSIKGVFQPCNPAWSHMAVYRVVRAQPKPITVLAPDHMPDWDEVWIAADDYGEVYCYDSEPSIHDGVWRNRSGRMALIRTEFRLIDRGTVDWDKSLICFRKKEIE